MNQKLPNATLALVLAIISYVACCLSYGIGGIVLSIIALVLANKDRKTYLLQPENYDNYSQVKTARILAIIGLILSGLLILSAVGALIFYGSLDGIENWAEEIQRQQIESAQ
ncbi:CCC motif membrane protein [Mesonia sp.]|uniref:CCC motif membrane protein n=1 Tax=Mesonia sp. TaxID=1960830 RepID=UPI003F9645F1